MMLIKQYVIAANSLVRQSSMVSIAKVENVVKEPIMPIFMAANKSGESFFLIAS
ncbi:hypothetical protein M948_02135 [Virgibacillus sp. CM-4]|nr:hypothetical protein M948_02135 [Virgibacillus sp. CM-4]